MRYVVLYFHFLRLSFIKALHFRVDFFFRIIMDCMFYAASIGFYYLVFKNTNYIKGWNFDQIMVFVGIFLFIDSIEMTFFSTNFWWLPNKINNGELDYYILRPVSSQFFLTLREFAANSLVNLLMILGLLVYSMNKAFESLTIWHWLRLASGIGFAMILSYSIQVLFALPAFWSQSSTNIAYLFNYFQEIREKPAFIYRSWFKMVFTTILPFCVITFNPALWVLDFDVLSFQYLIFISLLFFALSRWLWTIAIKNYGSASS